MATLPTDADSTPNYTAAQHATHHNTNHGLWNVATTKGDLIVVTGAQAYSRLAVGSDGQVLTADAASSPGVKWAASGAGTLGTLGYAQVTANQTGVTTSEVDLTSLSVTVSVAAGRRIRIHGHVAAWSITAGSPTVAVTRIKESTTVLNEGSNTPNTSGTSSDAFAVLTPSTGSHTYKLAALTDTGTVLLAASSTRPAFILVEDIGT